jgi:hypothetical protein
VVLAAIRGEKPLVELAEQFDAQGVRIHKNTPLLCRSNRCHMVFQGTGVPDGGESPRTING